MKNPFRSGYVAILGRPNAGKSTLLNALLGEKLVIVTPKPQTTRQRIRGILTTKSSQIVFIDTPGYHEGGNLLNEALLSEALAALSDAEVVLYLLDATRKIAKEDRELLGKIAGRGLPAIAVISKVDLVGKPQILPLLEELSKILPWVALIPVSATKNDGLAVLLSEIEKLLPEGPALFPEDQISDSNERFRAAEIIREKLFQKLRQELPYSIAVEILSFEEKPAINRISARILVDRDSQKAIVIGKGGENLKAAGTAARQELEELWGKKVFLELTVECEKDWTKDPQALRRLGYAAPSGKKG
ncbi:MAG: GTPase Era [Bdellovibrionota bacterium]